MENNIFEKSWAKYLQQSKRPSILANGFIKECCRTIAKEVVSDYGKALAEIIIRYNSSEITPLEFESEITQCIKKMISDNEH